MERMKVAVKVHPIIREYVLDANNGSDIITPKRGDLIWGILRQNLETAPKQFPLLQVDTACSYIWIELLDCHSTKAYNEHAGRAIFSDTLFRWYLSEKGQNKINNILKKNFKSTMHTFIMGQLTANPDLQQREAMEEFCCTFNLTMQKITPDMIKKSWDRSDHKRKLYDSSVSLNAIFF